MRLEAKKFLYDTDQAAGLVLSFTTGKDFADYEANALLRSDVERQFEIAGEALAQLAKVDRGVATRIKEYQRIIAFRNMLIHGYSNVDDRLVWDLVNARLPGLACEVAALLDE
jgi:uncharacterized protein with HEPN domain